MRGRRRSRRGIGSQGILTRHVLLQKETVWRIDTHIHTQSNRNLEREKVERPEEEGTVLSLGVNGRFQFFFFFFFFNNFFN